MANVAQVSLLSTKEHELVEVLPDGHSPFLGTLLPAHVVNPQLKVVCQHLLEHDREVRLIVNCLCNKQVVEPLEGW